MKKGAQGNVPKEGRCTCFSRQPMPLSETPETRAAATPDIYTRTPGPATPAESGHNHEEE